MTTKTTGMTSVTGVTIGTGAYRELAEMAAASFTRVTGLPAVVLGERERLRAGVTRPHHLKFRVFDLLDVESVVYFDADTVWLRAAPELLACVGRPELSCVRDTFNPRFVLYEATRLGIPFWQYFNSGLLVMRRDAHRPMLSEAERLTRAGFRSRLFDQSQINVARRRTGVRLNFLDRTRYNVLAEAPDRAPARVVLAHCDGLERAPTHAVRQTYQSAAG
jgi:hypothetical protein